jgi:hypothetical protein
MADFKLRDDLIRAINLAFSAGQIVATLNQLAPLSPNADCLSIVDQLGFLTPIHGGNLRRYRREVGIPRLNLRILTLAFRAALLNRPAPIPMHFDIVTGQTESVSVSTTPTGLTVVLTRLPRPAAAAPG